jgi:type IV secretory pathway VirB4 component
MVETFATGSYKEKFFGNLTLEQSLLLLLLAVPGIALAFRGFSLYLVGGWFFAVMVLFAGISFFSWDEWALRYLRFLSEVKRLVWTDTKMEEFIGVQDIDENTVFTRDGRVLSVVRVMPQDLGSLSDDDVARVLSGYGTFLNELSTNIQIIMSSTEVDVEGYLQRLKEKVLLSQKPERMKYFNHFADYLREMTKSKVVTDRDYYIVITQPRSEELKKTLEDLDTKSRNLMASLLDAGIETSRLGTEELIKFFSNFYNPHFKMAGDLWSPVTMVRDYEAAVAADDYISQYRNGQSHFFPMYQDRYAPSFNKAGAEFIRGKGDRRAYIIEQLMPSSLDIRKDAVCIEKLHRVLFTVRFPAVVDPGWLTKLVRQNIDFDIVFHIHPLSQATSISYLQHEITKLETDVTMKKQQGLLVAQKDQVLLDQVKELLQRVASDREKCFDVALYINVKAYSEKDLDLAVLRIKDVLEGMNAQVRVANWEMKDAIRSCYPLADDRLGAKRDRLFPQSAVRASFPFVLSSLEDKGAGAVVVGYNQFNGIPVLLDLYQQPNPNVLVLGSSGAGKSFMVKKLFLAEALQDVDMFIIDPQGEYSKVVQAMGGEVIKFGPETDSVINLFDLNMGTYDSRKAAVKAFFNIIRGNLESTLSGAATGIIDMVIDTAYRTHGIYVDDPGSWSREPPTFRDVFHALSNYAGNATSKADSWKKTTAEALLTYLTPFVSGDMRYLDRQTSVSMRNRNIVCFDISHAAINRKMEKSLMLFIVFDYIYSWLQTQPAHKRKMIILDEAWSVFENNEDYIGPIVRTSRKLNLSVVMISQNAEDLLGKDFRGKERGYEILQNTSTKFILNQQAANLRMCAEKFALTDGQREFVQKAGRGDILMLTPNAKIPILVVASEDEKRIMSTTPEEMKEFERLGESVSVDMEFDPRNDPVVPARMLSDLDKRRFEKDGYVAIVDSGLTADRRQIWYVKSTGDEEVVHFLRRNLIFKYLEFARKAMNLPDEKMSLRMSGPKLVDVSFKLPDRRMVVVEVLSQTELDSKDPQVLKKLNEDLLDSRHINIVVVMSRDLISLAKERGYKHVIMPHQFRDAVRILFEGKTEEAVEHVANPDPK